MKPNAFDYVRAKDVTEAVRLLADAGGAGRVLAGGQSLVPMMNFRLAVPELLLDVGRIETLRGTESGAARIRYGACITHASFEDGEVLDAGAGLMRHAASGIAYRAVRNRGTVGGSLAHADPAGDWAPVLIALEALVYVKSTGGTRALNVEDLIPDVMSTSLDDDELIIGVEVVPLSETARWGHYKIARQPGHFADAIGVVVVDPCGGRTRVALGHKRLPPKAMMATADALNDGLRWTVATREKIAEAARRDLAAMEADHDDYERAVCIAAVVRAAERAIRK